MSPYPARLPAMASTTPYCGRRGVPVHAGELQRDFAVATGAFERAVFERAVTVQVPKGLEPYARNSTRRLMRRDLITDPQSEHARENASPGPCAGGRSYGCPP